MRRLPSHTIAAIALAAALALPQAVRADGLRPVPLELLQEKLETSASHALGPQGLELLVDGNTGAVLPFAAQVVELDVESSGPVLLTWAARSPDVPFRPFGPPWRHLTLPRARSTVRLDFRIAEGWGPAARLTLGLTGAARVTIHEVRALPVDRDPAASQAAVDRAQRWAPEGIGHTTINFLGPAYWSATQRTFLADVVALAGAAVFAVFLGATWLRRRLLALGPALAAGCLGAAALWNVHLLARFLPAFHLRPVPSADERIREHYDVAPDVGALAALARETLRPDERIGVLSSPQNWFGPQTVCFNLAPRRCVVLGPEAEHRGISGVGRLRDEELDAVIVYRAELPAGFTPVAALGRSAVIARRSP